MKRTAVIVGVALVSAASYALGASTPPSLVASYSTLADTILGAKHTESNLVRAILEGHRDRAAAAAKAGAWDEAAAEMALFANEGDNAVGGVRKRLLEGGHHHNAEGEAKGLYEEGYVIVTKAVKQTILAAVASLRAAKTDAERAKAWEILAAAPPAVLAPQ